MSLLNNLNSFTSPETKKIQDIVSQRKITTLVHFTRLDNLVSILENGLVSRETAFIKNINMFITDQDRFDGHLDSISASISFPNYKMFFHKRRQLSGDWVVLFISPEVLWKKNSAFYEKNAASSTMSASSHKSSASDLEFMFHNDAINPMGKGTDRAHLFLKDDQPTDPQAEVMISETIEINFITDIIFSSKHLSHQYNSLLQNNSTNIQAHFCKEFFYPRHDHSFWKK